ncbi:MAG: sulfotransferase, partial [Gammaproteobacteria bacterium]
MKQIFFTQEMHGTLGYWLQCFSRPRSPVLETLRYLPVDYPELSQTAQQLSESVSKRDDIVFITGRFRSGSTLLWNLFRHLPDFTAYYEPFNERQWFNALRRGQSVDVSHRGVSDSWREYEGLEVLSVHFDEMWGCRNLFMDANTYAPNMKRYIDVLIEKAAGRPVLQFNRLDFRLPWIRHHYPNAKIIHVRRNPRDQWVSTLWKNNRFLPNSPVNEFVDHFYLYGWRDDLVHHFPCLSEVYCKHPYEVFYLMWRLSEIFGKRYAHTTVNLEALTTEKDRVIEALFDVLNVQVSMPESGYAIIQDAGLGKWKAYAPSDWFNQK